MRAKRRKVRLPIGRTAMLAFQIIALRDECCDAAEKLMRQKLLDESELEECARLDDALAEAHRILKSTLTSITILRLRRRSQAK
jgi:hypothetical protein